MRIRNLVFIIFSGLICNLNVLANDATTCSLLNAASAGDLEGVVAAITAGADVNATIKCDGYENGLSALHLAVSQDYSLIVSELLKQKQINVNIIIKECGKYKGFTPLHLAAFLDSGKSAK
ncbi:MAG: hypothetical protein US49_C0003G0070 [candidate division TM6 bacterium GW2011_GWF2_37_49]|nr:MAG: hypothetical protein US49_C0003G0070 [candidate division TM6 bacterium GW2011_GWF2_37_49]